MRCSIVSLNPFLTPTGWKQAGDLKDGDWVASARIIPSPETSQTDEFLAKAEILGMLLGDGSYTSPTPRIETHTPEGDAYLARLFAQAALPYTRSEYGPATVYWLVEKPDLVEGLFGKRAWDKHIPERFMIAGTSTAVALLRGLWQSDGWVYYSKRSGLEVGYSSTSRTLLKQIRALLLTLGISAVEKKPKVPCYTHKGEKRQGRLSYGLRVRAAKSFYEQVACRVPKIVQDAHLFKDTGSIPTAILPQEWVTACYAKANELRPKATTKKERNQRENRWAYKLKHSNTDAVERATVENALDKVPHERLSRLLQQIEWYQVRNYHKTSELYPTIDFEVPETHNALVDFTFQHNTTFALNWASQAALGIGFNVAIFSQEMPKEQIWRILGTIHSSHPKWEDRKPLLYEQVKSATLSPEDEVWLMNTLIPDLRNPEHGKIIVYDPLPNPTIDEIRVTAETINRTDPLDMMIIDYIGLLNASPSKKKMQATAGAVINENLKAAKQMALDFNEGQKILVVTPHQINRKGFESAQKSNGVYEFSALSDANEAERSADVVITVFADDPLKQRHEAVGTMLKNRDGRVVQPWNLFYSPEHRIMGNIRAAGEISYQDVVDA